MPRKNLDSYVGDTYVLFRNVMLYQAGPSGRSAKNVVLRPLTYSDCGFESHWGGGHGCLLCFVLSGRGFVQRSPTDCGTSLCVI